MSGILTAVNEMSGILLKVREVSEKKSCQAKVKWPKTMYFQNVLQLNIKISSNNYCSTVSYELSSPNNK